VLEPDLRVRVLVLILPLRRHSLHSQVWSPALPCIGVRGKRKSCGAGYALAIGSCERVDNVDTYAAAAPDVITAFAVPNPDSSSQSQPVFSGLVARQVASPSGSPGLLQIGPPVI